MPIRKKGKKYAIGKGPAVFTSKEKAEAAMRAMYAGKKKGKKK